MSGFLIGTFGYLLNAVSIIFDKFFLGRRFTSHPVVYTFYIGVLSIFVFLLAPFGLKWPGLGWFFFDLFVGFLFFMSLLTFYQALDVNEASRVTPLFGALRPILVLFLSWIFLQEGLIQKDLVAFFFLVLGGLLMSVNFDRFSKFSMKGRKYVIACIIFSALYLVAVKYIFSRQGFITGFIWPHLGLILSSAALLFWPRWRKMLLISGRQATTALSAVLVLGKGIASLGSLFINLAISRANVALVSALQGTEYAFLLLTTIVISRKFPQILEEKITRPIIFQKAAAIILIGVGLVFLAL